MNLIDKQTTDSTLLIPEKFFQFFQENVDSSSRELYFSLLLNRYKNLAFELFPKSEKVEIVRQEEGQNLVKVNFRPLSQDWLELGLIAGYLGISRTALFSWFLLLDFAGWSEILPKCFFKSGYPTKISPIIVKFFLSRRKFTKYKRKIHYKIRE